MSNPAISSTSQLFLNLYDITNDLIILDDGAVAMVIVVSAMNFGLLSEDEQDATIYAYAGLLNSLSFPTQIVIRSQPKDVSVYLQKISTQEQQTTNPLYKQRIRDYRQFVESLVQEQNVLDKKFYFVVPLSAVEMGLTPSSVLPGAKAKPITSYDKSFIIDKAKINLEPRRDHLIDQLARIGLYSRQLTTQELIQMLYSSYNPESFEGQKITDTKNYITPLVEAQLQTAPEPEPVPENEPAAPTPPATQPQQPPVATTSVDQPIPSASQQAIPAAAQSVPELPTEDTSQPAPPPPAVSTPQQPVAPQPESPAHSPLDAALELPTNQQPTGQPTPNTAPAPTHGSVSPLLQAAQQSHTQPQNNPGEQL